MKCIHPRHKTIFDTYSGEARHIIFPCGRCAACLKNVSDSWSIRLIEECKVGKGFIYDTLTLRDDMLEWIDVSDAFLNGFVELDDNCCHHLFDSGYKHVAYSTQFSDARVPYLSKSVVSDWFKRGRDACRIFHKRKFGKDSKCDLKYFAVLEYGPKWSRPHVHLLAFGVSFEDWVRFWAKPWRRDFGFTKTKWIPKNKKNHQKSRECISHYVTKYINKGFFEVPLVKAGLQPRPWRCISKGIGENYLQSERFVWLGAPRFQFYKHCYSRVIYRRWNLVCGGYYNAVEKFTSFHVEGFKLDLSQLNSLVSYCDSNGFFYPLPRYYRERLLGRRANLLKYEVQNFISKDLELRRDQEISRIAASLERGRTCKFGSTTYEVGVSGSPLYLASLIFDAQQENKARMDEVGCFSKLKNHYLRPIRYVGTFFSKYNCVINC